MKEVFKQTARSLDESSIVYDVMGQGDTIIVFVHGGGHVTVNFGNLK